MTDVDKIIERMWTIGEKEGNIPSTKEIGAVVGLSSRSVERREMNLRDKKVIGRRRIKRAVTPVTKGFAQQYVDTYTQMIYNLKESLQGTPIHKPTKITTKKVGDTLNVLLADWHVGRTIKDEYGNVVYNTETFKQRAELLTGQLFNLVDKYVSKGTPITNVNILSTGDIADGSGIFATQETLSELSPPFQVTTAVEVIRTLILSFLARELPVSFYGVKGNHGEIRVNGKNKDPNANWDLMIYLMLDFWANTIVNNKKLSISYSELDYLNFDVRGWKYHIRHIAPSQSETAAGKAKYLGWIKKHNFKVLACGHLHHWGVWDRSKTTIIRGGSLTGEDEFSETLAEESEPVQVIWGCNESRPVSFIYPLDLGKKEKK